jgi:hypothetical protein
MSRTAQVHGTFPPKGRTTNEDKKNARSGLALPEVLVIVAVVAIVALMLLGIVLREVGRRSVCHDNLARFTTALRYEQEYGCFRRGGKDPYSGDAQSDLSPAPAQYTDDVRIFLRTSKPLSSAMMNNIYRVQRRAGPQHPVFRQGGGAGRGDVHVYGYSPGHTSGNSRAQSFSRIGLGTGPRGNSTTMEGMRGRIY